MSISWHASRLGVWLITKACGRAVSVRKIEGAIATLETFWLTASLKGSIFRRFTVRLAFLVTPVTCLGSVSYLSFHE